MASQLLALTVRQPWAWAIVHGGKDVENRTRRTNYRGPLLIHAGVTLDPDGLATVERLTDRPLPSVDALERGAIIGVVEVVDCVRDSGSPWAEPGSWHWCLAGARALEPVPWRGRLGLWPAPPGTVV